MRFSIFALFCCLSIVFTIQNDSETEFPSSLKPPVLPDTKKPNLLPSSRPGSPCASCIIDFEKLSLQDEKSEDCAICLLPIFKDCCSSSNGVWESSGCPKPHLFHDECIKSWWETDILLLSFNCPSCRTYQYDVLYMDRVRSALKEEAIARSGSFNLFKAPLPTIVSSKAKLQYEKILGKEFLHELTSHIDHLKMLGFKDISMLGFMMNHLWDIVNGRIQHLWQLLQRERSFNSEVRPPLVEGKDDRVVPQRRSSLPRNCRNDGILLNLSEDIPDLHKWLQTFHLSFSKEIDNNDLLAQFRAAANPVSQGRRDQVRRRRIFTTMAFLTLAFYTLPPTFAI